MEEGKLGIYVQTIKNVFNLGFDETILHFSSETLEEMLELDKFLVERKYITYKKADLKSDALPGMNFKKYALIIKQNENLFSEESKHA